MAKFKFRLATLMKLREAARQERRAQLAQAYQAEAILQEQEQTLEQELAGLIDRTRDEVRPGQVNVDRLLTTQRYELLLYTQQKQTHEQRQVVAAEIEQRRAMLVEADRQLRVLEKLKERKAKRHRDEENRREIKWMDEVAGRCVTREEVG